jgi:hypothetical protein
MSKKRRARIEQAVDPLFGEFFDILQWLVLDVRAPSVRQPHLSITTRGRPAVSRHSKQGCQA